MAGQLGVIDPPASTLAAAATLRRARTRSSPGETRVSAHDDRVGDRRRVSEQPDERTGEGDFCAEVTR